MKKKVLIIGLGKSGIAAAELSAKLGYETIAIDEYTSPKLQNNKSKLEKEYNIKVALSYSHDNLPKSDLIVISPGIKHSSKLGKILKKGKVEIISEIEFAYRHSNYSIIGITGTNGKTTVAELCTHILSKAGNKVVAAGNIGYPFSSVVLNNLKLDFVILELSSFQLANIKNFTPHAAVILNIGSDHIDWHQTYDEYSKAKFNIFRNITSSSNIIINYSLKDSLNKYLPNLSSVPTTFSYINIESNFYLKDKSVFNKEKKVFSLEESQLYGKHNYENIMAAAALCNTCGIKLESIPDLIKDFCSGPHRLEIVAEKDGIKYINDSKSTNPDSLIAALNAVGGNKNVLLIAGGLDKNMDFSPILEKRKFIKKIFLIGNCQNKLAKVWNTMLNYQNCNSFEQAVNSACIHAKPGDVVLLSPACASMDMFENYIERGNLFKNIINRRLFS